jgi:predicted ATPase/class 3 adenylate cyclase
MRSLPRGTVTFLFTDVEGSTRLLHEFGAERYAGHLAAHRRVIRQVCDDEGGIEVDTQGDAFFVAFPDAEGAVRAAGAIAELLDDGPIRVRIGIHTGTPLIADEGYVGEDVHLGARIAAAGHGGQVLLSRATREAIAQPMPIVDLGEHRLKDIGQPIAIYQLGSASHPPLRTISNTNVPRPADSFIGRADEVAAVLERVRSGSRLITLAGPGGTGKTRLAVEAAASLLTDFKAGVFWVDLVPVRDPDAVAGAVGATLTTEQDLVAHIGEREILLVLDNFEHVISAGPWVGSLVRGCPNLCVLVTSRERMRIRGESLVDVPPLEDTESSRLFAERSGLQPSADIEELCSRLEHLPLAIELAAARAASLTPRQILDRLAERLDLLKGGRDADPRQRTLRATIEWSHDLLDPDQQRLFRRLSVFAGGGALEAITEVCAGDLDTLESLIDKSLVRFGDGRYTMLETVREFAAEQLEASGEETDIRRRHAGWIQTLMAAQVPLLTAVGSDELGTALGAELGNINAAFAWHVTDGNAAGATALLDAVWSLLGLYLWQTRAGLAICDAILAMPELSDADRAIVRHQEGFFASNLDAIDRAREAWSDAASLANRAGDATREGQILRVLALLEDPGTARRLFERALALARPTEERDVQKWTFTLANLAWRAGDAVEAERLFAEVHVWATGVGDYQLMIGCALELGAAALLRGDASEALERATRSLDLATRRGVPDERLLAEILRCRAAARLGKDQLAVESLANAMDLLRQGDLESDAMNAADALRAAIDIMAVVGDTDLASRLDAARSRIVDGRPWYPVYVENVDRRWLETHGLTTTSRPHALDTQSALAAIRAWLADRDAITDSSGEQQPG